MPHLRLPTILLAFADSKLDLDDLKIESTALKDALLKLEHAGDANIEREESATREELFKRIQDYREELVIFHYAGHAHDEILFLEDQPIDMSRFGLLLGQAPFLQLVFLNGCKTRVLAKTLRAEGVKVVIATKEPISDRSASAFARKFYFALSSRSSIGEAFEAACAAQGTLPPDPDVRHFKRGQGLEGTETEQEEENEFGLWEIFGKPEDLAWKISLKEKTLLNLRISSGLMLDRVIRNLSLSQQELLTYLVKGKSRLSTEIEADLRGFLKVSSSTEITESPQDDKLSQQLKALLKEIMVPIAAYADEVSPASLGTDRKCITKLDAIGIESEFVKALIRSPNEEILPIDPSEPDQVLVEQLTKAVKQVKKAIKSIASSEDGKQSPDELREKLARLKRLKSSLERLYHYVGSGSKGKHNKPEGRHPQGPDGFPISFNRAVETIAERNNSGDSVSHLWVTGPSGVGKTGAMTQMWAYLLGRSKVARFVPIPIFVYLTEFQAGEEKFIERYITKHYLKVASLQEAAEWDALWKLMDQRLPAVNGHGKLPTIMLFLDGTIHTSAIKTLNNELIKLSEKQGLQIIYCTDNRQLELNNKRLNWDRLEIQALTSREIELKIGEDSHKEFRTEIQEKIKSIKWLTRLYEFYDRMGDSNYDFKPNFSTEGEFLWNFFEAKISNAPDVNLDRVYTTRFYLRQFIPSLIFRMLKLGKRELNEDRLFELLQEISSQFYHRGFLRSFPEYRPYFRHFLLTPTDWVEEEERFALFTRFCEDFGIMLRIGQNYVFLDNEVFDFMATLHVYNDITRTIRESKYKTEDIEIPECLWDQRLPLRVLKYLGEIEGLHQNTADPGMLRLLEHVRIRPMQLRESKVSITTYNLLNIWKESKDYYPNDLTQLDLRGIDLSRLSKPLKGTHFYLPCDLEGALIMRTDLLEKNKLSTQVAVNDMTYSPLELRTDVLFCALSDGTIRLWDMEKFICYRIIRAHEDGVEAIAFCQKGTEQYLVSAAETEISIRNLKNIDDALLTISKQALISRQSKDGSPTDKLMMERKMFPIRSLAAWINFDKNTLMIAVGTGGRNKFLFLLEMDLEQLSTPLKASSSGAVSEVWTKTIDFPHRDDVTAIAVDYKSTMLATGGTFPVVRLYDITKTEWQDKKNKVAKLQLLQLHHSQITALAFSKDGRYVGSASTDDTIIVWDTQSKPIAKRYLKGHFSDVNCLEISDINYRKLSEAGNVSLLVSGGEDGQVIIWNISRIWDTDEEEVLPSSVIDINTPVNTVSFIQKGNFLAAGDRQGFIYTWDTKDLKLEESSSEKLTNLHKHKLNNNYDLQIQGCRILLDKLHPESNLSTNNPNFRNEDKEILRQYGVITDQDGADDWEDLLDNLNKK